MSDRRCADAILYILRTGCQWAALNETDLCATSTAYDRFRKWVAADMFLNLWQVGIEPFDELLQSNFFLLRSFSPAILVVNAQALPIAQSLPRKVGYLPQEILVLLDRCRGDQRSAAV
ncbi:MAG: transposase [Roseiflexus sp.]|nr:transposase [Roseiflexus sp.]MBO9342959.1 transposase [Roseiflexus sp.]MBO9391184.1 transposase [Roseiflexus sp.]